ncbi:uncharacterized protein MONOS_17908 [Monocercomonoides exilis]|uniref:uncharacterized protein n=1 Tax=Monocercomonoides exilis TaxID=2049356 RepID=UPI0035595D12|nr:hypothetical protein MONOS_17908 [Monocercomonoides exilis]
MKKLWEEIISESKNLEQAYQRLLVQHKKEDDWRQNLINDHEMRNLILSDLKECSDADILTVYLASWTLSPYFPL